MSRNLLLDHSVPRSLRFYLIGCDVKHAFEMNWHELRNGDLLEAAEKAGFGVLVTADRNLRYQQRLAGRQIAIIELSTNHWPTMRSATSLILAAVEAVHPGSYHEVSFARRKLRRRPPPVA